MKQKARKLLSLLLALVMVCGMMSTALAEGETPPAGAQWSGGASGCQHGTYTYQVTRQPTCYQAGTGVFTCTVQHTPQNGTTTACGATCTVEIPATNQHSYGANWVQGVTTHYHPCTTQGCTAKNEEANHTFANGACTVCGARDTSVVTLTPSPANTTAVSLNQYDSRTGLYYASFSVTPSANAGSLTYAWYLGAVGSTSRPLSNTSSCTVYSDQVLATGTKLTCYAYAAGSNTPVAQVEWTISNAYTSQFSVGATVYDTNPGYALGDVPDEGNTGSIVEQINSWLSRNGGSYRNDEYIKDVTFTSGDFTGSQRSNGYLTARANRALSENELASVTFIPTATLTGSNAKATATFNFTLTTQNSRGSAYGNTYYGTLTFTIVEGVAGAGIVLTARTGENLTLSSGTFQDFWAQNFSNGVLSYVEFTSVSGGNLYADYNGTRGTNVVGSANPTPCYVNPTNRQTALDGLTLVPSSNRTSTVTIRFTARGSSRNSSGATSSRSGTITVLYMNSAANLTYDAGTSGTVSLNSEDFTNAYRTAVGNSAPSNMTIRFTSLPANGTLTYRATNNRTVTLTSANMGSYDFSTRTSGSNRINDVTYTAGRNTGTADTAEFICYSGGTPRFVGTITFNAKPAVVENLSVQFSCTSASGIPINAVNFYNSSTAVSGSSYIALGLPSSGSLYLNGVALNNGARLSFVSGSGYPLFSNVTYQPTANTPNGTVSFPFYAYNANGDVVASGTVQITVNLPAPVTPPTTPTNPVNPSVPSANLKDVPAGSWYATYVNALVSAKVIGGYADGTFRPASNVTYGEALALIMRAVGYNIQQGSGSNWAMPYLTQAAADGLLPTNAAYGLNDAVDRYTIAQITAKAMRLTPVTGATSSPFSDTNDPYVLALHNAGIIGGTGSGFEGNKTLSRAEVSAIIYRIYQNNGTQQPSQPQQPSTGDDGSHEPDRDAPWGY